MESKIPKISESNKQMKNNKVILKVWTKQETRKMTIRQVLVSYCFLYKIILKNHNNNNNDDNNNNDSNNNNVNNNNNIDHYDNTIFIINIMIKIIITIIIVIIFSWL